MQMVAESKGAEVRGSPLQEASRGFSGRLRRPPPGLQSRLGSQMHMFC